MKAGQADEAQSIKKEVESINEVADSAEQAFNEVCRFGGVPVWEWLCRRKVIQLFPALIHEKHA